LRGSSDRSDQGSHEDRHPSTTCATVPPTADAPLALPPVSDTPLQKCKQKTTTEAASCIVTQPKTPVLSSTQYSTCMGAEKGRAPLPLSFAPHEDAVICGRGRRCKQATGNKRLRTICGTFLDDYAQGTNDRDRKKEKGIIVSKIVEMVRVSCPESIHAFVRYQEDRWWEVDDLVARQKVTAVLRDGLSSKYKSSTKAKVAKRRMENVFGHAPEKP
jgi:hypothetical protein